MDTDQETLKKLKAQTKGGASTLRKFFIKSLDENPDEIRTIELTYFSLSITSIVFLQFSDSNNKKKLLDQAVRSTMTNQVKDRDLTLDQALDRYEQRLAEYSDLFSGLFNEDSEVSPIVTLFDHVYECVMGKSPASKVFRTVKVGKIVSQYIIDSIKYAKQEYRTKQES